MLTPCAHPGCPELLEDTGPQLTAESYCPAHRVFFEPEPDPALEERIDAKLEALRSLRHDHVKYRTSGALLDHYNRVALPTVQRFVRLLHETGRTDRLADLAELGYEATVNDDGEVTRLRIRGWGISPRDYGP